MKHRRVWSNEDLHPHESDCCGSRCDTCQCCMHCYHACQCDACDCLREDPVEPRLFVIEDETP